ncbi:MAG: putative Ig domain-containing protein [Streptosporangiaceae bacterium]
MSAPVIASAAPQNHAQSHAAQAGQVARPALPAGERYVCPPASAGTSMTCMSIIKPVALTANAAMRRTAAPQANGPYTPSDLQKAYRLVSYAAHNGRGRTVAIVDAFSDPHAAADLAKFRKTFRLPACTTSSGCLHLYNQKGASRPLPRENKGWAVEEALDLDMVSAVCPLCHIDLIEATSNSNANLYAAENTAARKARYVSNSWGNYEYAAENRYNHNFNHPGHVIDFAAGDLGYGSTYPASVQYVTSVGGTSLTHSGGGRGWTESVWGTAANSPKDGTASGCSTYEAKPSWQRQDAKAGGCAKRTENDAAAVANPNTGVVIYTSIGVRSPGFYEIGGTSASTPIVTAIYALAGTPVANTYPAQYPYLEARHLFDVTTGANGTCGTQRYLCHGKRGFDGPTGLGTPDGIAGFTVRASVRRVTLVDPGPVHAVHGHSLTVKITGLDTRKVSQLHFSASGLPGGLSVHSIAHSTNGHITGTPSAAGTYHVSVTGRDGSAAGPTYFTIIVS